MTPPVRTTGAPPTVVTDPDAARLVLDARVARMLAPFMGAEVSLADAAREASVPLNTMKYRLQQFERLGLVERAAVQARRGRSAQTYRAAAALFVPFHVTPLEAAASLYDVLFGVMHGALLRSVGAAWQAAAGDDHELGLHVYRTDTGRVTKDIVPLPVGGAGSFFPDLLRDDRPAVWNSGGVIRLTRAEAKAFQRDLVDLLRRHFPPVAPPLEASSEYIYRFVLAPHLPAEES